MSTLSDLNAKASSALSLASLTALSLSNLVLVTAQAPTGYQAQSLDGTELGESFLFDYEGDQSITLQSDITDHFVEDNTSLQDQISLKPRRYSTRGYIGELNDIIPTKFKALKIAADKLTIMSSYTPELTVTALVLLNQARQIYDTAQVVQNSAQSVIKWWNDDPNSPQTKQAKAYQQFDGYWSLRILFTIQTPWRILKNMAIENLKAVQGEDTNSISDFEITFKEINFAKTKEEFSTTSDVFSSLGQAVKDLGKTSPGPQVRYAFP